MHRLIYTLISLCIPYVVTAICTIPTVHHSNNDASNVILKHGQSVTYTCNDGYYSEDVLQLTCRNERFTHDPPVCRESECVLPDIPIHLEVPPEYNPGERVIFGTRYDISCEKGYTLNSDNGIWECIGGEMSFDPVCNENSCPPPANIKDGYITYSSKPVSGLYLAYTSATYNCNDGFKLSRSGVRSRRCREGKFKGTAPTCTETICTIPTVHHSKNDASNVILKHGQSVTYTCNDGYYSEDVLQLTCQNERFTHDPPVCRESPCPGISSDHLQVAYNNNPATTTVNGLHVYEAGTIAGFLCVPGNLYYASEPTATCRLGQFQPQVTCEKYDSCPPPANIKDGYITYSSKPVSGLYLPYTSATYNCNDGFKLSRSGARSRRCREGKFKGTAPTCTETICTIPTVHHSNNDASNVILKHGQSVTYTCNDGYYSEDVLQLTCRNERFTHDPPVCRESPCPGISSDRLQVAYDNPATTTVNGLHVYEAGTIAVFLCDPGNLYYASKPKATCRLGQFQPQVTCEKSATCPSEEVTHATVSYKDETDNNYIPEDGHVRQGVTRAVQCAYPYTISGKSKSVCTNSGQWSENIPSCEKRGFTILALDLVNRTNNFLFTYPVFRAYKMLSKCVSRFEEPWYIVTLHYSTNLFRHTLDIWYLHRVFP
ncbi:complement factor H-like [Anneissia japonica]|uniref:complement factor H-like n=1 Tax=Anneissia japonica TaxID=1529436 RepID=UPI00142589A2|nr:complement factor H-like [Anneissia japonica]